MRRIFTFSPARLASRVGVLFVLLCSSAWAYHADLDAARQTLEQGEHQAAYQQLQALELEYGGEPEFDYWLGVAALRAGAPSHALIALERVILRQPRHAGARMERVAALLQLDQRAAAEREIERLQALSPPPDAEAAIGRFQAAIEQRQHAENSPQHQGRFGIDIGHDSNPQRFPGEVAIDPLQPNRRDAIETLLAHPDIEIDESSIPQPQIFARDSSTYQRLQGSYQGTFPVDGQSRWLLNAVGQAQRYSREAAQDYDLTLAQAELGYQRDLAQQRVFTLRGAALQGWSGRSQDRLLTRWGSRAELSQPIGLDSELTWQLGVQHNRYSDARNDHDTGLLGIQLTSHHSAWRTRLVAQVEQEWANDDREGGDVTQLRLGGGVDYPIGERQLLRADLNHRLRSYQDDGFARFNDFSATQRRDRIWQARLTWLYQFSRDWLVEASADVERRRSSVDFFDTSRRQTQVGIRYLF
ncbi:hypothetical protein [Halomonas salipaludis]|uniref:Tetratricopeptide repeat-containing protein n=1 Tax=Halomonas salipaludis TaxID=2032625 RepID=A0A2A2F2E9_9GAMM|nr:hypothetical protein [Halomonas salipaludis]PAU78950.1 hypothetical protein CK498_00805 [Halomonas salipaludis]